MLDYRIDTFLTLCDCMNYRRAADRLHISQPAVTQQIRALEAMYGQRLFTYESRRLEKTPAARTLERYARAARLQEQNLRASLAGGSAPELKVGATKTIGDYFLGSYISRYLERGSAALTLIVDNTEHLLRLLEDGALDFAVVEGFFDRDRFDSILLRREPFVGICRRGHPFAGREASVEELMRQTIIHREAGSGTRAILEQQLSGHNEALTRFPRQICISSFKLILELVKQGYGISFVYEILARSDPELATFTLRGERVVREFNIVYLKYADLCERIDLFFGGADAPAGGPGAI